MEFSGLVARRDAFRSHDTRPKNQKSVRASQRTPRADRSRNLWACVTTRLGPTDATRHDAVQQFRSTYAQPGLSRNHSCDTADDMGRISAASTDTSEPGKLANNESLTKPPGILMRGQPLPGASKLVISIPGSTSSICGCKSQAHYELLLGACRRQPALVAKLQKMADRWEVSRSVALSRILPRIWPPVTILLARK